MKVVIVTGAAGNLGEAIAKEFLAEGWYVIGTVNPGSKKPLNIDDKNFQSVAVDLTKEEEAAQFVAGVIEKHKQIDAAVLTVGGFAMGKIAETKTTDIVRQYTLNFQTAYNVARPVFIQMMKQKAGRIFMTGSRPGSDMHLSKGMVAYGLSKSMIFRLAELMNDEAKGTDVITHVIAPSTIDTPENRQSMPDADTDKWVKPEEIAKIVRFYCSAATKVIREPVIKTYNNA